MTDFTVKGRLDLDASGFAAGVDQAAASEQRLVDAGKQVAAASTTVAAATGQAAEATQRKAQSDIQAGQAVNTVVTNTASHATTLNAVTKASATARASIGTLKAANDDLGKSVVDVGGKLTGFQKQQLGFQLNDVFTQLASGQGVIRTFVQQGPQITQVFGGLGNALKAIPLGAAATALAIGAVAGVFIAAAVNAEQSIQRQRQFTIELQATGNAAGTTVAQLERLVQSEALRPGAGRTDTATALGGLLLNSNLDQAALERTLALARDYARITGQDLPAAAQQLSKALDGSSASARQLDQLFNFLTASELEQIRNFEAQGNRGQVVATVLTAMERNFKSANEQGISPTTKSLNDLGAAWAKFETSLANSGLVQRLLNGTATVLSNAAQVISSSQPGAVVAPGPNPTAGDVAKLRGQLQDAQKQLNDLLSLPVGDQSFARRQIDALRQKVVDLRTAIGDAENRLYTNTVNAATAADEGALKRAQEDLKKYTDQLERLNTVTLQRGKLQDEATDIRQRISLGGLSPEQLAASNERLQTIQGQLYALGTPADLLQRKLDLEGKLAALPPHLRAAQQAYEETKKAALAAGDSQAQAEAKADQARRNALQTQASATQQQIDLLSAEAQGALAVAAAYDKSRAAGLQAAAQQAAAQAEASGAIAPDTAGSFAQDTLQKDAAAAVAAQAEKNRVNADQVAGLKAVATAEAQGSEAARDAQSAYQAATIAQELRAKAAASGSAAIVAATEREIATNNQLAQQQLQIDRQRAGNQLNAQYDPNFAYQQRINDLRALQQAGVLTERTVAEATKQYEQDRLDASRNTTDGMIAGLKQYTDEATNAGKTAAQGVQQSFQSMEDALVQFVTSGQINFGNLTNSILADLARVAIRQGITGPLSSALGNVLGSWFGGGSNAGGFATVGSGAGVTNGYPNFTGMHAGGIVGRDVTFTRPLDPAVFANARRYHSGGLVLGADEVPIIARKGERVLTESQQAGWGAAPRVTVNLINQSGQPLKAQQRAARSDGMGGLQVDLVVDQLEQRLAGNVLDGRGTLAGALQTRYGLQPQGA